ncbi:MAG: hypothetical protein ACR2JM_12350 [Mycobacterium sp.]
MSEQSPPFGTEAYRVRLERARKLFFEANQVTHPELRAALWNNLNAADRQHWLDLADRESDAGD